MTAQPFSHRNGETDLPVIDGTYWFKGVLGWDDDHEQHNGLVDINDGDIFLFGRDKYWSLADTTGAWWGPIVLSLKGL